MGISDSDLAGWQWPWAVSFSKHPTQAASKAGGYRLDPVKHQCVTESPGSVAGGEVGLLKHRFLPLFPQTLSSKSRFSPKLCISSKFADSDDATGPETTL